MASRIAVLKADWRRFKDDPPGDRFEKLRDRMHRRSPRLTVLLAILGGVMVLGGIVLMFIPGPGIPVIALGLGLIGTASRRVARMMDRVEPWARRRWSGLKRWWRQRRRAVA